MRRAKRTGHIGMSDEVRLARMSSIGGSDARIIMSGDQDAIESLWRQKRGESEADDLSEVLVVQLGNITENLNTDWFEMQSGLIVSSEQARPTMADWPIATCTLDGLVHENDNAPAIGVFEAKFMLPFYWEMDKAVTKYYAQLQHNCMVADMPEAWLSVLTGGANYAYVRVEADPLYQFSMLEAEKAFWDCVQSGRTPGIPRVAPPKVDASALTKVVDMIGSNEWAMLAADFTDNIEAVGKHAKAIDGLKLLIPADAKEANGYGVKVTRAKNGNLSVKPMPAPKAPKEPKGTKAKKASNNNDATEKAA